MTPRLLHVITRLCVGGAQLTLLESARDLAQEYDIAIAYGPDAGNEGSIEGLVRDCFPTYLVPCLRRRIMLRQDIHAMRVLRTVCRAAQPHIVHTHSSKAGILGRLAAAPTSARVVHSIHGWGHTPMDPPIKRRLLISAERATARLADVLIAVSNDVRDEGVELGIGRPAQYRVVPEYVDYVAVSNDHESARARARQELDVPATAPLVGWVGRFMPQKDPATLATAVARTLQLNPDAWMAFVGDGPHRKEVECVLTQAGVRERARFAGFRADARRLYAAFDVLLHTSRYEGQPRVVQEAIAERVPVVTARVSGTHELIAAGDVGTEVDVGASEAMAAELVRRLADPRLRAPLDAEAIAEVAARYGREASRRMHQSVYAELMSMGPRDA